MPTPVLPVCNVNVRLYGQDGVPQVGARVTAKLNSSEVYAGYIVPQITDGVTDVDGLCVLPLWPNALGSVESSYTIKMVGTNGKTLTVTTVVPNQTEAELQDISVLPPYPGKVDGQVPLEAAIEAGVIAQQAAINAGVSAVAAAESQAIVQAAEAVTMSASTAAVAARDSATASAATATTQATTSTNAATTATTQAAAASASATTASSAATTATTQATAAANSASAAAASQVTASSAATTATTQATTATNAATTATTQATNASNSASAAATSETNAASSAAAAASSAAVLDGEVGSITWHPANVAPSGKLKANGATLSRTTYARLWTYAQASGNLVAQGSKQAGNFGTGDGSTTFTIPDLRGEFPRGWDDGRGVDAGRGIGTAQAHEVISHAHGVPYRLGSGSVSFNGTAISGNTVDGGYNAYSGIPGTTAIGGAETRPRNVALLACIKF